ncbi:hypothetical protein [Thermoactinospora rubra]|uniref:hypothetical protein n=1 Tax=Thermoactinospora rubra TaxID=1088767 RepID=UPI000A1014C0|nr:hypothetical protein [Thermoactinospora rubra]
MMRVLIPSRVRAAVRARLDARYAARAELRAALDEVSALRGEVAALGSRLSELGGEVAALREQVERLRAAARQADDTRRLALETAEALDRVLQDEVLLWQAVDAARPLDGAHSLDGARP